MNQLTNNNKPMKQWTNQQFQVNFSSPPSTLRRLLSSFRTWISPALLPVTTSARISSLLFPYQQLFVYNTTLTAPGSSTVDKGVLSWCYGKLYANDSHATVTFERFCLRPYNSFPQILLSGSPSSLNWLSIATPFQRHLHLHITVYSSINTYKQTYYLNATLTLLRLQ